MTTSDFTDTSMVSVKLNRIFERVHRRVHEIEGVPPDALEEADRVLEEEGHADGGDQGDEPGRAAQRAVGDALHGDGEEPTRQHADQQHHDQHEERREDLEQPHGLEGEEHLHAHEGAHHEDLGVGEVDELEHTVHHGVPERDQGVHEAQDQAVEEDLREDPDEEIEVHGTPTTKKGEGPLTGPSPSRVHSDA